MRSYPLVVVLLPPSPRIPPSSATLSLGYNSAVGTDIPSPSNASIAPDIVLQKTVCQLHISPISITGPLRICFALTSQMPTLLQMVYALLVVAFAHFLPDQPRHHALHPLLPDDGILCSFQRLVVVVVHAVKCWRDLGLGCFERFGFWGGHCGGGSGGSGRAQPCVVCGSRWNISSLSQWRSLGLSMACERLRVC